MVRGLVQKCLVNGTWFGTEMCLVSGTWFGTEMCLVKGHFFCYIIAYDKLRAVC